jgi:two-component system cell cycle sensor histidine kinase/response regulator CckA
VQRLPVTIPPDAPRGTETILIVEDDVSVRTFLEDVLTQQGYRVLVAEHGEAALELARDHREIDLILADIVLPGQNGLETVSRLEEIQPGIPALFISGYADPTAPAFAALAAADQVLAKPFSAEDLLIRLRQVLGPSDSDGLDSAPA